jgi:hypothetical protein
MVRRTVLGLSLAASLLAVAAPAVVMADTGQPSAIEMDSYCVGGSSVTVTTLSAPTNPGPDAQFLTFVHSPNCMSTMTVVRVP